MTPDQYAAKLQAFAQAMKAADPSIKIGAVGGRNFGRYAFVHDESWNRTVLQRAGGLIDFLAVHNGYAPLVVGEADAGFDEVYRGLLAFPRLVAANLDALDHDIREYAPTQAGRIQLAITEWGPLFAFVPSSRWVDHAKTLGSALFVASLFRAFLLSPRVGISTFFKLTGDSFMGSIGANGEPKPSDYALQMYSRHFGSTVVATRDEGPTFDSAAVGLVSAVDGVPYLESVASTDTGRSRLFLTVINKHPQSAIETTINLGNFKPQPSAKGWTLTGPGLDANNGPDVPSGFFSGWAKQAQAPQNPQFQAGTPGTVAPQPFTIGNAASRFTYIFPPRSVTAIELVRAQGR